VHGTDIEMEALVWIYLSQRCYGCGNEISGFIIDSKFLNR
jgi:hypothetical protein